MKKEISFYTQPDAMDCGPTCLRMVAAYHGKHYSLPSLREKSHITREGVSLLGISDAAEAIGFRTMGVKVSFEKLKKESPLPCIAHWRENHFVVVYKIAKGKVYVADPRSGKNKNPALSNPNNQPFSNLTQLKTEHLLLRKFICF